MDRKEFIKLLGAGALSIAGGSFIHCAEVPADESAAAEGEMTKHWVWMRGNADDLGRWKQKFAQMRAAGIDAVLLGMGKENLVKLIPLAQEAGLEVHAWMFTMMRGGHEETHPEWYAVNRNGVSTATDPPYVDYYKFMCPSREGVQQHLVEVVTELAQIDGVTSVHLDYVRYPDVILPISLWPKYDLVQDKEYPEFDYCYCEVCRERFKAQTGLDPLELEDPPSNEAWLHFRYDNITRIVHSLTEVAHAHGKQITAAVFPTPTIAKTLVRQDWTNWNLDAVLPMVYHNFYEEDVPWVGTATAEGVQTLNGKFPLYSGLFIPSLTPDELVQATALAMENGARGVVLFEGWGVTDEHWEKLAEVIG